ncbi:MAG TPA: hypothetical protein VGH52_04015, partial [Gaiellaceae bacterium]
MPRLELHPLSDLRSEAAALLAERFARQRAAEPLLPEIENFEPLLPAAGLVATRGGEAVAYLADEGEETHRVSLAGQAAREPEALRNLFAALAAASGRDRFGVAVPASAPDLIDVWFKLAFGCQFMWAVRETELADPFDFGGVIRPGTSDDLDAAASFDEDLIRHQQQSPSFSGMEMPSRDEMLADWADTWEGQDEFTHFVAELDGRVVGQAMLYTRP